MVLSQQLSAFFILATAAFMVTGRPEVVGSGGSFGLFAAHDVYVDFVCYRRGYVIIRPHR